MSASSSGPLGSLPVATMGALLEAVDKAMRAEGVDDAARRRVRNRLVWGHPDGADAIIFTTPEEIEQARQRLQVPPGDATGRWRAQ